MSAMKNRRDFLKISLALAATCVAGETALGQKKRTKKEAKKNAAAGARKIPGG